MTRVLVYIEGPSDRLALEALLAPLLSQLRNAGTAVHFFDIAQGDRKKKLLLKVPERAVNVLRSQPNAYVVAMPDLYPKNRGFPRSPGSGIHRSRIRTTIGLRSGCSKISSSRRGSVTGTLSMRLYEPTGHDKVTSRGRQSSATAGGGH